jgi:hypothetical protein
VEQHSVKKDMNKKWYVLIAASVVILVVAGVSYWAFCKAMHAETTVRYTGLQRLVAAQLNKTITAMEMSATNVFNAVEKHLDTPEAVVHALEEEANLNPEVRGYFAAFEPYFFPEKGKWYEPYVHQNDSSLFEVSMVGSARHDYTQSQWYKHAKDIKMSFWSEPYYYYDGTSISGHYCTFVKPIYAEDGKLACVCGADITFEWLTKALQKIDEAYRHELLANTPQLARDFNFFSLVVDHDGACIVHPDSITTSFTDPDVLRDFEQQRPGVVEMEVTGVPSLVYYGPIDGIDWSVAVVAQKADVQKPFNYVGWLLLVVSVIAIVAVWFIFKRIG